MSHAAKCPQCPAVLRYAQPPAQPKKVKCPKCGGVVVIPAAKPEAAVKAASSSPRGAADAESVVEARNAPRPAARAAPPVPDRPSARRHDPDEDGADDLRDDPPRRDPDDDDRPRRRRRRPDDEDDDPPRSAYPEEEEDRPRRRRKKAKAKRGGKGLVIGLSIGGALLVVGGIALVLFLTLGGTTNRLIGKWQPDLGVPGADMVTIEFTGDGRFITEVGGMRAMETKYRVLSSDSLEIDAGGLGGRRAFRPGMGGPRPAGKETGFYRFEGDVLIISDRRGGNDLRLRRR